jgi:hypothetical protein
MAKLHDRMPVNLTESDWLAEVAGYSPMTWGQSERSEWLPKRPPSTQTFAAREKPVSELPVALAQALTTYLNSTVQIGTR